MLRRASICECRGGHRLDTRNMNLRCRGGLHCHQWNFNQDVATYGGLCTLASFDRAELKVKGFVVN